MHSSEDGLSQLKIQLHPPRSQLELSHRFSEVGKPRYLVRMSIEPYKVQVSDSQLEQLRQRLSLTSFPDELDEAAWDLGSPLADVKRLASYWKDGYDWRKAEERINTLPQFTTTIQAENFEPLKIHFVHHRSQVGTAIPLLFVHGCKPSLVTAWRSKLTWYQGLVAF